MPLASVTAFIGVPSDTVAFLAFKVFTILLKSRLLRNYLQISILILSEFRLI